jgi:hypothetical protein
MSRTIRNALFGAALLLPFLPNATAHADVVPPTQLTIHGAGNYAPGLPCPGNCTDFTLFDYEASGGSTMVGFGCIYSGTTGSDTLLSGQGEGEVGYCALSGYLMTSRTAFVEVWSGELAINGSCHTIADSVFTWVPVDPAAPRSYVLDGQVTLLPCG